MLEWYAFYVIEDSDQDPEVTEWDDEASALRKMERKVKRAEDTRVARR